VPLVFILLNQAEYIKNNLGDHRKRNSGPSASIITDNQERYSQIATKHHATMIYICINLKEIHKSRGKLLPHTKM